LGDNRLGVTDTQFPPLRHTVTVRNFSVNMWNKLQMGYQCAKADMAMYNH